MKTRLLISLIGILLGAEISQARCQPGVEKCVDWETLRAAVATPEEAARLKDELASLGVDAILKSCQLGQDSDITEFFGSTCGDNVAANHICRYSAPMSCYYKNKNFEMSIAGECLGTLHDCGTFEACARDNKVQKRKGSFRSPTDAMPKGSYVPGVSK